MNHGTIEKRTIGQTELGDGVPVIKPLDIWPVLLSCGRSRLSLCGFEFHLTLEGVRQDLVDVGLVARDDRAVRQGGAD